MSYVKTVAIIPFLCVLLGATRPLSSFEGGCGKCDCHTEIGQYGRRQQIANCSLKGLTTVPSNLPRYIHDLDLSQNNLRNSSLEPLQLYREDLSRLLLSHNNISYIDDTVLTSLKNLDSLDLTGNTLDKVDEYFLSSLNLRTLIGINAKSFSEKSFQGLKGLEYLSIVFEQTKIPADIFKDLSLVVLDVSFRESTNIPGSIFRFGVNTLTTLTIDGPNLISLPDNLFTDLTILKTVTLRGDNIHMLQENIFNNGIPLTLYKLQITGIQSLSRNILKAQRNLKFVYLKDIEDIPPLYLPNQLDLLDMSGSQIFRIPSTLFTKLHNLRKLILTNASLASLEENSFNGLRSLSFLNLSRNDLFELPVRLFEACRNTLESLDLSYNRFKTIPNIYFNSIKSLRYLNLSKNKIIYIAPDAFSHLRMLTSLNCAANIISEIPENLLQNVVSLRTIDLSSNNISEIHRSTFFVSNHLEYINLENNPVYCNCDLEMIKRGFRYVEIDGVCKSPIEYNGIMIRNLDTDIDCDTNENQVTQQVTTDVTQQTTTYVTQEVTTDITVTQISSLTTIRTDKIVPKGTDKTMFQTTHASNTSGVTQEMPDHFEIDDINTWGGSTIAIICIIAAIVFCTMAISFGLLSKSIFEKCQRSGTYILPPPKVKINVYGSEENIFSL